MSKLYTYYGGTYLKEKNPGDTRCTLFVRHYLRYKTAAGTSVTKFDMDAVEYVDEQAMVAAIESEHMRELPEEADGNPRYIPQQLRSSINRRVNKVVS